MMRKALEFSWLGIDDDIWQIGVSPGQDVNQFFLVVEHDSESVLSPWSGVTRGKARYFNRQCRGKSARRLTTVAVR